MWCSRDAHGLAFRSDWASLLLNALRTRNPVQPRGHRNAGFTSDTAHLLNECRAGTGVFVRDILQRTSGSIPVDPFFGIHAPVRLGEKLFGIVAVLGIVSRADT